MKPAASRTQASTKLLLNNTVVWFLCNECNIENVIPTQLYEVPLFVIQLTLYGKADLFGAGGGGRNNFAKWT
jgi:hypothetical protein